MEQQTTDKKARLNAVMKSINKKFGENTVMIASQANLTKSVIKTPSLELNNALYGGLSGIVELFGSSQSGKTSLMLDTIALNQKENPDFIAAWMETENSVTKEILAQHNIDLDRLIFWKQEDVGKGDAESSMDVARAFLADGTISLLVINSVAGLSPSKELEEDMEKQNMALTARVMSKFFRVSKGFISKNDIVTVFINQTRDNIGQMFGDPSTTTGGKALGFYADQRIRMSNLKIQAADPIAFEEGVKINNKVKKNRMAGTHCPYTECTYYALFDKGIDSIVSMPSILKEQGILKVKGAHWYYCDDNDNVITLDGIEGHFSSKQNLLDTLRENKIWYNEMLNRINGVKPEQQTEEEIEEAINEEKALNEEFASLMEEESA